jgi:hypothetical protein
VLLLQAPCYQLLVLLGWQQVRQGPLWQVPLQQGSLSCWLLLCQLQVPCCPLPCWLQEQQQQQGPLHLVQLLHCPQQEQWVS